MDLQHRSRRAFLKTSAATAAVVVLDPLREALARGMLQAAQAAPASALERRPFGKTDMKVTVLGFGGAEIGYERADPETVSKLLNSALDGGLNVVDTAECYVDSEVLIGNAIGHRRKEFFLFTKVGHAEEARGDADSDWAAPAIRRSIERSLKRLKTDVLDLVQLHSCSIDELKKGECIDALEDAKEQGLTRYIGYSGDSQAARYAVECGRFDALQTSLNLCDQEAIELTLPLAKEKQMGVITKRPIANAVWRYDKQPDNGYHVEYWRRLQALDYPFAKGDAAKDPGPNGAAGIAMRFTAAQPGVSVLIVGTSKADRWKQNAELMKAGPLPKEMEEQIRAKWKATAKKEWTGQT